MAPYCLPAVAQPENFMYGGRNRSGRHGPEWILGSTGPGGLASARGYPARRRV